MTCEPFLDRSKAVARYAILIALVGGYFTPGAADEASSLEAVQSILKAKCISCHGPEKQEGGLRLDSPEAARRGGETGPAIVPGDLRKSLVITAILFENNDLQMPPKQKLSEREISILSQWVKNGAAWPDLKKSLPASGARGPIGDAFSDIRNPVRKIFQGERLDLWSLKPPALKSAQSEQSIDQFIQNRLARVQLTLSPEADRRTLIRRLYYDLTGLPPTFDEVLAFTADKSPDAYEKIVDRLLASHHYGERQAQHWLDVVRYADTNGYERDEFRPLAWQFRDYVIRAFNQDKPFDQFIREQLAGDELVASPPVNSSEVDALIATGFLRLGQWDSTAPIFQEEARLRADILADLTNTTASAFLGLTMSCCQCHDHKYDPLTQSDHYRLRAFFSGITNRDDLLIALPDEVDKVDRNNALVEQELAPLKAEKAKLGKEDKAGHEELARQIAKVEAKKKIARRAMGATDSGSTAPVANILAQGDFQSPRDEVQPGFPSIFTPTPAAIQPPRDNTTGRRLALAHWIASIDNPWTTRVIVNRIWQQHFGVGLVATPNDFGYTGARPTHPELLDWLAASFVQDEWSIKKLHRRILLSATYRQGSGFGEAGHRIDPDNHLLWRQRVRRCDAETLRDGLLATTGLLKTYDGGSPLWPPVSEELRHAQPAILEADKGGDAGRMQGWYANEIAATDVRSIYLVRKRSLPIPFLQVFDLPDTAVSCARRDETVVAPQALTLFNSDDSIRYAKSMAGQLLADVGKAKIEDHPAMQRLIDTAFRKVLQRNPTPAELKSTFALLQNVNSARRAGNTTETETEATIAEKSIVDLCRALLNLNEFAYVD